MLRNVTKYVVAVGMIVTGLTCSVAQTPTTDRPGRPSRELRKQTREKRAQDSTTVRHLDSVFVRPDSVLVLNLVNQGLTALPESVAAFTNVHTVQLTGNAFTSIPAVLAKLPNLRRLTISRNALTTAVFDSTGFPALQFVDLSDNPIDTGSVTLPRTLVTLHMSNCRISQIPASALTCTSLETLDVANNPLKGLPSDIPAKLPKLKEIVLKAKR